MVDNGTNNGQSGQQGVPNQDSVVTPIRDPLSLRDTDTGNLKRLSPSKAKKTIKLKQLSAGSSSVTIPSAGESGEGMAPAAPRPAASIPKLDISGASSKQTIQLRPTVAAAAGTVVTPAAPPKNLGATIKITPKAMTGEGSVSAAGGNPLKTIKLTPPGAIAPAATGATAAADAPSAKSAILLKAVPPRPAAAPLVVPPPAAMEAPAPSVDQTTPAMAPITPETVEEVNADAPTVSIKAGGLKLTPPGGLKITSGGMALKPRLTPTAPPEPVAPELEGTVPELDKTVSSMAPVVTAPEAVEPGTPTVSLKPAGLKPSLGGLKPKLTPPAPMAPEEEAVPAAEEVKKPGLSLKPKAPAPMAPTEGEVSPAAEAPKKPGLALKKSEDSAEVQARFAEEEQQVRDGVEETTATKTEPGIVMTLLSMVAMLAMVCSVTMLAIQYANHWMDKNIALPGLNGIEDVQLFKKSGSDTAAPTVKAAAPAKAAPAKAASAAKVAPAEKTAPAAKKADKKDAK